MKSAPRVVAFAAVLAAAGGFFLGRLGDPVAPAWAQTGEAGRQFPRYQFMQNVKLSDAKDAPVRPAIFDVDTGILYCMEVKEQSRVLTINTIQMQIGWSMYKAH